MSITVERPVLPDSVRLALQPAVEAIGQAARAGVRTVEVPRITRGAQVAVRANGPSYADGARVILRAIDVDPVDVRGIGSESDEEDEDHECDEHSCETCFYPDDHPLRSCCGWCPGCDSHPEGIGGPNGDHVDDRCDRDYCHDCDHYCPNH
jgi:hypothetical protein